MTLGGAYTYSADCEMSATQVYTPPSCVWEQYLLYIICPLRSPQAGAVCVVSIAAYSSIPPLHMFLTHHIQWTNLAHRFSGCADCSSVFYQTMTEMVSLFRWNDFPKFHLNFLWVFYPIYQSESIHQTDTVRVCYNRWLVKDIAHNQIGTFSSNSRKA